MLWQKSTAIKWLLMTYYFAHGVKYPWGTLDLFQSTSEILPLAVYRGQHRDLQLVNVQTGREFGTLSLTGTSSSHLFSWGSGNYMEEESERLWDPEVMEDNRKWMSFRHKTDTHINSQRWLKHAQDVHRCTSEGIPVLRWDVKAGSMPNQEGIANWHLLAEETSVLSKGVSG